MSEYVSHPKFGLGRIIRPISPAIRKKKSATDAVKVRFFQKTDGKRIRHLSPKYLERPVMLALAGIYEPTEPPPPKETVAEQMGRFLLIGIITKDMSYQTKGFFGLLKIAKKACRTKNGRYLFIPHHQDAIYYTATDIILEWLHKKMPAGDIKWIGRKTRSRMIDQLRKYTRHNRGRELRIGATSLEKGRGFSAEEVLEFLAYRHGAYSELDGTAVRPDRKDLHYTPFSPGVRQCRACRHIFEGRADAKFCSPKCRKRASRSHLRANSNMKGNK